MLPLLRCLALQVPAHLLGGAKSIMSSYLVATEHLVKASLKPRHVRFGIIPFCQSLPLL